MHAPTAGARIDTSRAVDVYGPLPSSLFLERYASRPARILKRSASNSARSSSQTAFSSAVHFAVLSRLMRLLVNAGRASESLLNLGIMRSSSSCNWLHVAAWGISCAPAFWVTISPSNALRLGHWVSIIRVLHTGNVSQPGTNYATT